MKPLARLLTVLFLLQTLLATPAQAGVLLFPASNQPQVQIERSQAAINVIAAGNWRQSSGAQNGLSFQGNASAYQSQASGSETSHDNTQVIATGTLSLKSGGDTRLIGAQVAGGAVKADVGGNLQIQSLQDQSDYQSQSANAGFAVSVCIPPICYGSVVTGSVSVASSTIEHNYQSAQGQSGIAAGTGGFDINVKGNTDLKGGAITSSASADKNSLSTASLTSSDLQNRQTTGVSASSFSAAYSGGNVASTLASNAAGNVLANAGAGAGLPDSGSQSGSTQSVISPGRINVTGSGNAPTDAQSSANVATLTARDPKSANGALANTLTLQQSADLERKQKEASQNAQAAQLVGSVLDGVIGDLSVKNNLPEGSPAKTILHGISGVVQASLGGTSGLSGFAAGVVNEQIVGNVAAYLEANGIPRYNKDGSANPVFGEFMVAGTRLAGAGVGALTGGAKPANVAAAGSVAGTATVNNYLSHDQSTQKAARLANAKTQEQRDAINAEYAKLDAQPRGREGRLTSCACRFPSRFALQPPLTSMLKR